MIITSTIIPAVKQNKENRDKDCIKYYTQSEIEHILCLAFNLINNTQIIQEKGIEIRANIECDGVSIDIKSDNRQTRIKVL